MNKKIVAATGFVLLFSLNAASHAQSCLATLKNVTNKVLVNQGKGLVSATEGMCLNNKDQVVTLDKSSTVVDYKGCTVNLTNGKALLLDKDILCKNAVVTEYPQAVGGQVGVGGLGGGGTLLMIGGIGGLAALAGSNGGNDKPISPQ